jgi:hypothetical protein
MPALVFVASLKVIVLCVNHFGTPVVEQDCLSTVSANQASSVVLWICACISSSWASTCWRVPV